MAQDISITMGLDDTQVLSSLNRLTTGFNTMAAQAKEKMQAVSESVKVMGESVKTSTETFEKLGAVIVGIGFAEFIRGAFEASAQMVNTANSLGVSTRGFMEMNAAMIAAGKGSETLGMAMSKMEIAAGKAADGDQKMIDAFSKLGVSMQYMQTHSAEETFNKIAAALAGMENPAQKALLMQELLGRGFKGADLEEYVKNFEKLNGTMGAEAEAAEKAAHFNDQLKTGIALLKEKVVDIITSFTGLTGNDVSGIIGSKKAAEALLGVFGILTGSALIKGITTIVNAIKSLGAAFIPTSAEAVGGSLAINSYAESLTNGLKSSIAYTAGLDRIKTAQNAVATETLRLNAAIAKYGLESEIAAKATDKLAAARERLAIATEAAATTQTTLAASFGIEAAAAEEATVAAATTGGVFAGLGAVVTGIATAIGGFIAAIGLPAILAGIAAIAVAVTAVTVIWRAWGDVIMKIIGAGIEKLKEFGKAIYDHTVKPLLDAADAARAFTDKMGWTTPKAPAKMPGTPGSKTTPTPSPDPTLIAPGSTKDPNTDKSAALKLQLINLQGQYAVMQATNKAAADRLKLEIDLVNVGDQERKSRLAEFDAEVKYKADEAKINQEITKYQKEMTTAKGSQKKVIQDIIATLQQEAVSLTNNKDIMKRETDELVKQQDLQKMSQLYTEATLNVNKQIADIQLATSELTMTADEKRIADVQKLVNGYSEAAIKARSIQLGHMPDTAEIDKIKSQYAHIADGMTTAITEQNTIRDSWSTGWTNAFKTYVDDATNAAKLAQSAFNVFTNNITNAIDTFVKTGKFNFKSFATSIITELLAMEMKMQAMKLFSMLSGPGGTFAHIISSIFGFADGGDPPVGKASLVGENGPELFVPKQAGTIIPNSALGGQQPITNVTNNTYNINAIDAQSVAQFFAANRRLAYAAVTTAQNEMPYNNSRY